MGEQIIKINKSMKIQEEKIFFFTKSLNINVNQTLVLLEKPVSNSYPHWEQNFCNGERPALQIS